MRRLLLPQQAPFWPLHASPVDADAVRLRTYAMARGRAVHRDGSPRSAGERALLPVATLLWPLNAALRAWQVSATTGASQAGAGRRFGRARSLWQLAMRDNVSPETAARFRLDRADRAHLAGAFLSDAETGHVLRDVWQSLDREMAEQVNDKLQFARLCRRLGLPTVPVLTCAIDGGLARWEEAQALPPVDLVAKVTTLVGGQGFQLLSWDPQASVHRADGAALSGEALLAWLSEKSRGTTAIVQPRVSNHEAIRPLAGRALSSLRIVTAIDSAGLPRIACAAMRMGTGTATVDNIAAGGLSAPVDVQTGRLVGPAAAKSVDRGWFTHHPDSRAAIDGFQIPHWEDAARLATTVHGAVAQIATVGWDVVVTPDGPVLLEGNLVWDSDLAQSGGVFPIGRTGAAPALVAALKLRRG